LSKIKTFLNTLLKNIHIFFCKKENNKIFIFILFILFIYFTFSYVKNNNIKSTNLIEKKISDLDNFKPVPILTNENITNIHANNKSIKMNINTYSEYIKNNKNMDDFILVPKNMISFEQAGLL
jgi:hypothetical protein